MFEKKPKIKVYDAMCGQGKTERIIKEIASTNRPVIYISPLLSEVDRICGFAIDDDKKFMYDDDGFIMYDEKHPLSHKRFTTPKRSYGRNKSDHIKELIASKENIASTHTLFSMLDAECVSLLKVLDYILVIDEDLNIWRKFELEELTTDDSEYIFNEDAESGRSKTDSLVLNLIENGVIEVDSLGLLHWQEDKMIVNDKKVIYYQVKYFCDSHQLLLINNKVVFWELPVGLLRSFSDILIATYFFKASYFSVYLKHYDFSYEVITFGKKPTDIAHLVNLVEGKINNVGEKPTALSYSSLCQRGANRTELRETLNKNLANFFKNICKSNSSTQLWTTYKAASKSVQSRYSKSWLAFSTKATNDYIKCCDVAYLCNNYPNVMLVNIVAKRQEEVFDKDLWALSTMLQFIFRSRLRKGEPINLYIPSKRMRELFKSWLEGEFDNE